MSLSGAGDPIGIKSLTVIMVPHIKTQNISKKLLSSNTDKLKWLRPFLIQRREGVRQPHNYEGGPRGGGGKQGAAPVDEASEMSLFTPV